jgi:hypothetical protein
MPTYPCDGSTTLVTREFRADPNLYESPNGQVAPIYQFYESARLAAHMYSLLCVYPYPAGPAPFAELAIRLRKELAVLEPGAITDQESKLLLWILFMGAIMTIGTPDRYCFVSALNTVSRSLEVESWQDVKSILATFLWLDMTNDVDGRDIWEEVSYKHRESTRFSSPASPVGPSIDIAIRSLSHSPTGTEEMLATEYPFSKI